MPIWRVFTRLGDESTKECIHAASYRSFLVTDCERIINQEKVLHKRGVDNRSVSDGDAVGVKLVVETQGTGKPRPAPGCAIDLFTDCDSLHRYPADESGSGREFA